MHWNTPELKELYQLVEVQKLHLSMVASKFGVSLGAIRNLLKRTDWDDFLKNGRLVKRPRVYWQKCHRLPILRAYRESVPKKSWIEIGRLMNCSACAAMRAYQDYFANIHLKRGRIRIDRKPKKKLVDFFSVMESNLQGGNMGRIEQLNGMVRVLLRVESYLRNGQVIYAYRHIAEMWQFFDPILDEERAKHARFISSELRSGRQIDAHNSIKSLLDKVQNELKEQDGQGTAKTD